MPKPFRLAGVAVIAILEIISSLVAIGVGIVRLTTLGFIPYLGSRPVSGAVATFMGATIILIGLFNLILAWGLWTGKSWA